MLLFISQPDDREYPAVEFQYITCYSLLLQLMPQMESQSCFNTSHVTLYLLQTTQILHMEEVSIHHMLLFITFREHTLHGCSFVSIHHMLLFICSRQDSGENVPGFQYITCYSLSKKRVRKNTGRILFQYITCYSLSPPSPVSAPPTEVFQYITCYSLSQSVVFKNGIVLSFQYITCYSLSFRWELHSVTVFLFQYITCYSLSIELADKVLPKNRFNTSHVTLYRLQIRRPGNRKHVSIHHMLLFIMNERYSPTLENLFQYITCYSLSKW